MQVSSYVKPSFWVACLLVMCSIALSAGAAPAQSVLAQDEVRAYINELVDTHEFDAKALHDVFGQVEIRQDIIEKISRPAEKVWTWARYKKHLVDERRISDGVAFWHTHRATLERAEQVFGVAPQTVLAILGIETRYGEVMGSYPVVEALTTLGFGYPPRAKFFRKELTEALLLAREEGKAPNTMMGSYAGAMGYGQFIPSSYRHYAVDFDDDGLRDIWQNPVDAIGSIANYFARHKWQGEGPTALKVTYQALGDGVEFDSGTKLNSTVGALKQAGMMLSAAQEAQLQDAQSAKLFRVEGSQGIEYWLALHDFYVITRYNHSHLYALAVHHIAEAIGQEINEVER